MLERLGEALRKATTKISNAIFLDKDLVDSIIRDLQRALIEADVNILLVKQISERLRKIALDEKIKGIEKKEQLVKSLHDELIGILGKYRPLELKEGQNRIMLLGLYGAGKTTTTAKIGNWFAKRGKRVAFVGLDIHRPAASEQLQQLAKKNNLACFTSLNSEKGKKEKDAVKLWKDLSKNKALEKFDLVLIDTAGRHNLDKELIKEIKSLNKEISPTETILVMPADIGQAAKPQVQEFKFAANISGVIITRMDSTAKGGGAITACSELSSKKNPEIKKSAGVYFITTGEKINDIEEFNPEAFLSRLLGMGDLQTLLEKIRLVTDEKEQKKLQEKLEGGNLSLSDIVNQAKSMGALGGIDKIKSMVPGLSGLSGKIPEGVMENQQAKIAKWEHILKSMTSEEKENPEILKKQTSRIQRIAKGAGVAGSDIRSLLKQYDLLNSMMKDSSSMDMSKGMSQKQLMKMMKKLGKKGMRF